MYQLLNEESKQMITSEYFISRNQKIYEGIEARDIQIEITKAEDNSEYGAALYYEVKMNSAAGTIEFPNQTVMTITEEGDYKYLIAWDDTIIFPNLTKEDKVRVSVTEPKRGEILDRNGKLLAGVGVATSVGIVPGKLQEDYTEDLNQLSQLLGISVENIEKKLSANWVKEDSFVPIKTISKLTELDESSEYPSDEALQKISRNESLLSISGVMLTDTQMREYPLKQAASHLTGYIQQVTAADLEKHPNEGYTENSVIGRSGIETLYEKELRGENGCEISIVNSQGSTKIVLANLPKQDGKNIQLTIDASLQQALYDSYAEDKSSSIAMNPYTGEVLALVSTPSFDSNDFIFGMSQELWDSLNADEQMPLYNRFRQKLVPGSSFKPIIAAIGLATGAINPEEDYGNARLSWQKDASWGNYFVTTLHETDPANLENAMINSDNIYFAKASLRIGSEQLQSSLDKLGFNTELPFEISLTKSQYSNEGDISSEIQLADSGYGQGQILVNPIHLAALYTGFANQGNVMKPYLLYQKEPKSEIWMEQAYSAEHASLIESAMEKVVNSPNGTGHAAYREDILLAAKTGTAEIKASKDDTTGTELGWFGIFTADPNAEKPVLLMNMVEDVKDRGGSGYVVRKDKEILDQYFGNNE
jgi:cell division protein FtsI/penicillin-binding protein 2